jgi:hypothetical protein
MILSYLLPPPAAGGYPGAGAHYPLLAPGMATLRRNRLAMFCLILLAVMACGACWGPSGRRGKMMPPTP